MSLRRWGAILVVAVSLSGCASATPGAAPHEALAPLGLGLIGPTTPPLLSAAAKAPYALPQNLDCSWLRSRIGELDAVLGPDVDTPPPPHRAGDQIEHAAADALVGMVPYRGVVRWLTGAGKRERAKAQAVLSAAARRGFLKGVAWSRACATDGSMGS